jgi:hypothetical protein
VLQAKPIDDGVHVSTLTRLRPRAKPGQVHKLLVALVVPTRERDTPGTRRSVRVRAGLGAAVGAHPSGYEVLRGPRAFPRAGGTGGRVGEHSRASGRLQLDRLGHPLLGLAGEAALDRHGGKQRLAHEAVGRLLRVRNRGDEDPALGRSGSVVDLVPPADRQGMDHCHHRPILIFAAETLSRFLIEARAGDKAITPKNLAQLERKSGPDALREMYLTDEIFAGDAQALAAMRDASDGFEHGYMDISEVRGLLEPTLSRSMTLVRRSLVRASGVTAGVEAAVLAPNCDEPRGLVTPIFIARGDLTLKDPSKPPPDDTGALELDFPLPEPTANEQDGDEPPLLEFHPTITALSLPDNVEVNVRGTGLRAAHVKNCSSRVDGVSRADKADSGQGRLS